MAKVKRKNPIIAAILNFFILGLGYLYSGKRTVLGIGFLTTSIILIMYMVAVALLPPLPSSPYDNLYAMTGLLLLLYQLVVSTTLAYDAYRETKN